MNKKATTHVSLNIPEKFDYIKFGKLKWLNVLLDPNDYLFKYF